MSFLFAFMAGAALADGELLAFFLLLLLVYYSA